MNKLQVKVVNTLLTLIFAFSNLAFSKPLGTVVAPIIYVFGCTPAWGQQYCEIPPATLNQGDATVIFIPNRAGSHQLKIWVGSPGNNSRTTATICWKKQGQPNSSYSCWINNKTYLPKADWYTISLYAGTSDIMFKIVFTNTNGFVQYKFRVD